MLRTHRDFATAAKAVIAQSRLRSLTAVRRTSGGRGLLARPRAPTAEGRAFLVTIELESVLDYTVFFVGGERKNLCVCNFRFIIFHKLPMNNQHTFNPDRPSGVVAAMAEQWT